MTEPMAQTFQQALDGLVGMFQTDVEHLVRTHAINLLGQGLTAAGVKHAKPTAKASSVKASSVKKSTPGAKRDPVAIEALKLKFIAHVKATPGQRIEQINKVLKVPTKDLRLPIEKAIADGSIKVKGEKRATTYHAK